MSERKPEAVWSRTSRRRLGFTAVWILGLLALLCGRLFYLQGWRGSELATLAANMRRHDDTLPAQRGNIVDRTGLVLAGNKAAASVVAYPEEIAPKDRPAAAHKLAPLLGDPEADVLELLNSGKAFVYLRRKLDMDRADKIRALRIAGIDFEEDRQRYYPEGTLAAQLLGFVNLDHEGWEGLELQYNKVLRGKPGSIIAQRTPAGDLIAGGEEKIIPSETGMTLQLTINAQIQRLAEQWLAKYVKDKGAKRGLIALEDPRTGEILALAMYPSFDPNTYLNLKAKPAERADWAVLDALEPGSIFKPITAAMALEERVLTGSTPIRDPGFLSLPGHTIRNFEGGDNGYITLGQALAISSNVAMGGTALKVGGDNFYRYLTGFNLDRPTGIDLPGEASSILKQQKDTIELDRALMGIGQSMALSPIQVLAAESVLANDGVWVQPHVIKGWVKPDGTPGPKLAPTPSRQVVSRATAQEVRNEMKMTMMEHPGGLPHNGTGTLARIKGYTVAGKTGTAEKTDHVTGKVLTSTYLASFLGFVPADNPQVVALMMLDEPTYETGLSGFNTAPLFADFMPEALQILGIKPDAPTEQPTIEATECKVPKLVGMNGVTATQAAHSAGYRLKVDGPGDKVTSQASAPDAKLACYATLAVTAAGDKPTGTNAALALRVPDVWQMPLSDVAGTISAAGFMVEMSGTGVAVSQDPAPGGYASRGSVVRVALSQP